MSDPEKLAEALDVLAEIIADKVAAKLHNARPADAPPAAADPAATTDAPTGAAPKRGKRPAAAPEPEPTAEAQAADATEDAADDEVIDAPTDAQLEFAAETADAAEIDQIKAELLDFYVNQGEKSNDISASLAEMSDEELRLAYKDYLARLVINKDDGTLDFTGDFETAYKAERVNADATALFWVKGGITLSDDEVKAAKLGDPNAKPAAAPAKPGLPKRTKRPGK
jgi:hypothetical protein